MWRISGTRIWRCVNGHCSRSYKNKFHLTYHLKYECGKQPLYKCDFCLRMFSRNSNLKKHMFTVHKYISTWLCPFEIIVWLFTMDLYNFFVEGNNQRIRIKHIMKKTIEIDLKSFFIYKIYIYVPLYFTFVLHTNSISVN